MKQLQSSFFDGGQRARFGFRSARVAPEKAVFRPALPLRSSPGLNGTTMTKMTYGEQLKHPFWQRKRLEVLERAEWKCERCYSGELTLHVHHKRYVKGRMAWEYEAGELAALCEECHEIAHEEAVQLGHIFAALPVDGQHSPTEAASVLAGWAGSRIAVDLAGQHYDNDPDSFRLGAVASSIKFFLTSDELEILYGVRFKPEFEAALKSMVVHLARGGDAQ